MKRIIGLIALPLISMFSYSQEIQQKNVPAVALNAFQLKFPNATDIKWRLEKGNYRIDFESNNKDNDLIMSDKGELLMHKQDLYVSEIPKIVLETIQSKVAFFDVSDADRLEEGGKIRYKVDLKVNDKNNEFIVDETGRLLIYTKELRDSEVPAQITTLIKTKYGTLDLDDALFTEESGKISYQLKGEINDKDHVFKFDDRATVIKHEQDLLNSEVPVKVMNGVKAAYAGFEVRDAYLMEDGGSVSYRLEMGKSKERISVVLNPEGTILKVKSK